MNHPIANLQGVLEGAVSGGVFPAAQAVVLHRGVQVFGGVAGAATGDTRFDLASVTKVLCTTSLFLRLWTEGKVGPETQVARFFPGAPVSEAGATVADLLYHRSGLPPFVPFFAQALTSTPELLEPTCPHATRARVREEVVQAAAATPLAAPPRTRTAYSDVGFILLGEILSRAAGKPLDFLFNQHVAEPLGLGRALPPPLRTAPRTARWPAPAPRARASPLPARSRCGANCPRAPALPARSTTTTPGCMDGVSGHAGLFGTAVDVARFGQAVLDGCAGSPGSLPGRCGTACSPRIRCSRAPARMGFDSPSVEGSSAGHFIGNTPPGAVGHLGFTGTSLWVDLRRALVVALVTNRVAHGRKELRIREFRPLFHDAWSRRSASPTQTDPRNHG